MIGKVESASAKAKHGESWRLINEITGRKAAQKGILKGTSKEDRLKKWHNHFYNLLGKEPVVEDSSVTDIPTVFPELDICDGPFTIDEYQLAKRSLTEGKSSGPDGIPPEVLKRCDIDNIILSFANDLIENGEKPDQWSIIDIIPLPKTGNLSVAGNYRGISLSSVVAKVTNKMILNRLLPELDTRLRPNQNGFRPGRTTTAHVLALRRLIEGVRSHNKKAVLLFLDFRKAFDSIHRGKMLHILRAYGIPAKIINAISKLYENTFAKIVTPDGETELFQILAGVLQGDTLAPYLFAIVLDFAMRQAIDGKESELGFTLEKRRCSRQPAVAIADLDFADDIALLAEGIDEAQQLLARVEHEANNVGLYLNSDKTEVMTFNLAEPVIIKAKSGHTLTVVENFKYLGSWMQST